MISIILWIIAVALGCCVVYWKDIIFMLVFFFFFFFFFFFCTVSASVTQNISCQVNKEVKIHSISIIRPSLADIFFIFITFSALGYHFPVIDANLHQHCFHPGLAMLFLVMSLIFAWNVTCQSMCITATLCITQTNNPQTTVISGLRK